MEYVTLKKKRNMWSSIVVIVSLIYVAVYFRNRKRYVDSIHSKFPLVEKSINMDNYYYREWYANIKRKTRVISEENRNRIFTHFCDEGSYVKKGQIIGRIQVKKDNGKLSKGIEYKAEEKGYIRYYATENIFKDQLICAIENVEYHKEIEEEGKKKEGIKEIRPYTAIGDEIHISEELFHYTEEWLGQSVYKIEYLVENYDYVEKDKIIAEVHYRYKDKFYPWSSEKFMSSDLKIKASRSGYIEIIAKDMGTYGLICMIRDRYEDAVSKNLKGYLEIKESKDEITNEIMVDANRHLTFWTSRSVGMEVYPKYQGGKCFCVFVLDKKEFAVRKGNTIYIILEDETKIKLDINNRPETKKDKKSIIVETEISKDDIEEMANYRINHFVFDISGVEKEKCYIVDSILGGKREVKYVIMKQFGNFSSILKEKDYWSDIEFGSNKESLEKAEEDKNEKCYVYIMKDEKNGCHKIGISNKPEYRERTLQSEKPFISMIRAKEFPNRKIALAFESALHATYKAKNIRGEWFELSDKEVSEVIETLG